MSEQNNHVVFQGQIIDGASIDNVKQKLAALFKINVAQAEAMLSGKPIYIKKNVDLATAKKYQAAMQKAGAVASVISAGASKNAETKPAKSASPTPQTPKAGTTSAGVVLPGNSATSEIPDTAAPQTAVNVDVENTDISDISMAAIGTDLLYNHEEIAEPPVDLSGLTLADENDNTNLSPGNKEISLNIDTSELTLK